MALQLGFHSLFVSFCESKEPYNNRLLSAIMSMISSYITLKIQRYLRVCYSDSTVSVLVFKHMMSGHYTIYLSSANDTLYRNHIILYQALERMLKLSGIFVLSLEVVTPWCAACTVPKTITPPEIGRAHV